MFREEWVTELTATRWTKLPEPYPLAFPTSHNYGGKLLFISGIREARTVESYTFIRCAIYFPVYRLCESRHCPNGGSSFMSFFS